MWLKDTATHPNSGGKAGCVACCSVLQVTLPEGRARILMIRFCRIFALGSHVAAQHLQKAEVDAGSPCFVGEDPRMLVSDTTALW